jgi:hypothetical protein
VGHDRLAGSHRQRDRVGRMAGEDHLQPVAGEHEAGRDGALVPFQVSAADLRLQVADQLFGELEDGRAGAP